MTATARERAAYRARLRALIRESERLDAVTTRASIDLLRDAQRQVLETLLDLQGTPSAAMWERVKGGLDATVNQLEQRLTTLIQAGQASATELGPRLVTEPLAAAGVPIGELAITAGVTTQTAGILQGFTADLIGGLTDELRKRITAEITAAAVGAKTPIEAVSAVGRSLTSRNHFRTIADRARAIVTTELGRAQAVATQAAQEAAQRELEPDGVILRKRWVNAHLPGARATHLAAEARYAPGGTIGPIPVDEPFLINGTPALYPRDPALSASESVHCHCVSITVLDDAPDPIAEEITTT